MRGLFLLGIQTEDEGNKKKNVYLIKIPPRRNGRMSHFFYFSKNNDFYNFKGKLPELQTK